VTHDAHQEALDLIVALEAEVMRQEDAVARSVDLEHTIEMLQAKLAIQERRAEHAEADASDLRGKLAGVLGSASWRATRPIRAVRGSGHPEHI
jgi:hypothetical protein